MWISEVGCFDARFPGFWQPPVEEWPLSGVIPQVTPSSKGIPFKLPPATYAIDYASLTSVPGQLPKPWVMLHLRKFFPEGSRLILTFFGGQRNLTLKLWSAKDWWNSDFLAAFDAVCGPDFHSYSNAPKAQTFIGERQQQIFLAEGIANGRTVIPQITWADEDSFRRQIEMLLAAGANTILLNCYASQVQPTLWKMRWLHAIKKYCAGHPNVRFLIAGMNPGWAIAELNDIFPERNYALIPTAQYAFVEAQRATVDKEVMRRRFITKIQALADLRSGKVVADRKTMPAEMPSFAACRLIDS
jgi:hypothetical protein